MMLNLNKTFGLCFRVLSQRFESTTIENLKVKYVEWKWNGKRMNLMIWLMWMVKNCGLELRLTWTIHWRLLECCLKNPSHHRLRMNGIWNMVCNVIEVLKLNLIVHHSKALLSIIWSHRVNFWFSIFSIPKKKEPRWSFIFIRFFSELCIFS